MMSLFPDKKWIRFAKGGQTSKYFKEHIDEIVALDADVYFLAIGCNDIRYRNKAVCAMDAVTYVDNMAYICDRVSPSAKVVCISPWMSADFDPFCPLKKEDKKSLYREYSDALQRYCNERGTLFVDPNPYIWSKIATRGSDFYLKDHIHCNASEGIRLFSKAVQISMNSYE